MEIPSNSMHPPMKTALLLSAALVCFAGSLHALAPAEDSSRKEAEGTVEEMRGFSMQAGPTPGANNGINLHQLRREGIMRQLRAIGKASIPALAVALKDHDAQMRANAALVLLELAGGFDGHPKMDIRAATHALIKATGDFDSNVRAWSAQALGEIGPVAKEAVPALIKLVVDPDEGSRNSGCIALGKIGPGAKEALPALQKALNDPSKDVRQFAKAAIEEIQVR